MSWEVIMVYNNNDCGASQFDSRSMMLKKLQLQSRGWKFGRLRNCCILGIFSPWKMYLLSSRSACSMTIIGSQCRVAVLHASVKRVQ